MDETVVLVGEWIVWTDDTGLGDEEAGNPAEELSVRVESQNVQLR